MPSITADVFRAPAKAVDTRLFAARQVITAYAVPAIATRDEAMAAASRCRDRVRLAAGLEPTPPRGPLHASIGGRIDLAGFSIEKVCFESRPGFLVAGNLYRPSTPGPHPAILSPHGHWPAGRLEDSAAGSVPRRCAMLAKLGFVVFAYDMIGYNDSCQLQHRWPPRVARQSLLYGIGQFGLQLWNSIRATDFVAGLPDVDAERIGCTGASGGGTQTYYLALVDERIKVTAPVCMMSSHFQGGCTCEQAPFLHLDGMTTVDVVAALAPRPVLLTSVTGDWTNANPDVDVPAVRRIYALFAAEERVANVHFDAGHNYNRDTREHVYAWFRRWLLADTSAGKRIVEQLPALPAAAELRLFADDAPPSPRLRDEALLSVWRAAAAADFAEPVTTAAALKKLRRTWLPCYRQLWGAAEPVAPAVLQRHVEQLPSGRMSGWVIGRRGAGDQVTGCWCAGEGARQAALVVAGAGKAALFTGKGPGKLIRALLDRGVNVLAIDLLGIGESAWLLERELVDRNDPLDAASNRTLLAHRVQDVLTGLAVVRRLQRRRPILIADGLGAVAAMLARPLAGPVGKTLIDLSGCDIESDAFWLDAAYHPFIRRLGDLRGSLALGPQTPLLLGGASRALADWAKSVYRHPARRAELQVTGRRLSVAAIADFAAGNH